MRLAKLGESGKHKSEQALRQQAGNVFHEGHRVERVGGVRRGTHVGHDAFATGVVPEANGSSKAAMPIKSLLFLTVVQGDKRHA